MGERVSDRTTIRASADVIRDVVYDLSSYPQWADGVSRAKIIEEDAQGRPHRALFDVDAKVVQVSYVIEYEHADDRIAWHLVEGDTLSQLDGSYDLRDVEGGTEVTYAVEADLSIPLPGFLKKRAAKQIVESGLRGLKRRAEARA